jgi:hypothetical protein
MLRMTGIWRVNLETGGVAWDSLQPTPVLKKYTSVILTLIINYFKILRVSKKYLFLSTLTGYPFLIATI